MLRLKEINEENLLLSFKSETTEAEFRANFYITNINYIKKVCFGYIFMALPMLATMVSDEVFTESSTEVTK